MELRVKLLVMGLGIQRDAHPIFGDGLQRELSKETGKAFFREKINGKFTFVREDFTLISNCSDDIEFTLQIYRGNDLVGISKFHKCDCEFDYDDKVCSVTLVTADVYEDFIGKYTNVYNLVSLAPERTSIGLTRRGVLQVYVQGETKVTNIVGNLAYERDVTRAEYAELIRSGFSVIGKLAYFTIKPEDIVDERFFGAIGEYALGYGTSSVGTYYQKEGSWFITISQALYGLSVTLSNAGGTLTAVAVTRASINDDDVIEFMDGGYLTTLVNSTFNTDGNFFGRILTSLNVPGAVDRTTIEDIYEYDRNYRYALPLSETDLHILDYVQYQSQKTEEPTKWGIDSEGMYYTEPALTNEQKRNGVRFIPLAQSLWTKVSHWLRMEETISDNLTAYDEPYELRDAFPIKSAISVLLREMGTNVTEVESAFLSVPRASDPINMYPFPATRGASLYLTPITNIKRTFYEQAAQRGDLSLRDVLDMLTSLYRCVWWIEGNTLRIEHSVYLANGKSYADQTALNVEDIRTKNCPIVDKPWTFNENKVVADKTICASRYEFAWPDAQTEAFNGYAIDILDKDAQGAKESVTIPRFVADVDYIMLNPSSINDDLYVLLEATDKVAIPEVRLNDTAPKYKLQNGYASILFAEKAYYPYDLSGWKAVANGATLEVLGVRKNRKQSISFPWGEDNTLFFTELGMGELDSAQINLETLNANATLLLGRERDYMDSVKFSRTGLAIISGFLENNTDKAILSTYGYKRDGIDLTFNTIILNPREMRLIFQESQRNHPDAIVLSAVDVTPYTFDHFARRENSHIEPIFNYNEDLNEYTLVLHGNEVGEEDFIATKITARKDLRVYMEGNSERGYDFGWANPTPCLTHDAAIHAQYQVSGDDGLTFNLLEGESIYIGYTKDISQVALGDFVTFFIKEV